MTAKTTNPGSKAGFIRALLARKCAPSTILEKAKRALPRQKPTMGYINWLAKRSKGR
jgi:hypothetical protein